jgi:hypothetical protein
MVKYLIAALAALSLGAPLAAQAQDTPSYAEPAQNAPADEQIRGRISSFDGGYNLTVRDERGFIDNVQLHQGTIINPTGLTLAPGMVVSILGFNEGSFFAANEVDTPYTYDAGVPYYYGHPWNYYGPSISLGFFFGNAGWWHGNYFQGGYHYADGGRRVYNNVHVTDVYRAAAPGAFQGRHYVAPREHGGYYAGHAEAVHSQGRGGPGHR